MTANHAHLEPSSSTHGSSRAFSSPAWLVFGVMVGLAVAALFWFWRGSLSDAASSRAQYDAATAVDLASRFVSSQLAAGDAVPSSWASPSLPSTVLRVRLTPISQSSDVDVVVDVVIEDRVFVCRGLVPASSSTRPAGVVYCEPLDSVVPG